MSEQSIATIASIILALVGIMTLIIGIIYRYADGFDSKSKKYHKTVEDIYLLMLDIYTSSKEDKETLIRKFLNELYVKGINTTMLLEDHFYFLQLKEMISSNAPYRDIEVSFDILAKNIEKIYWENYETNQYTVIQSKGWVDEQAKKLLIPISSGLSFISKVFSHVFWLFPLSIIFLPIYIIVNVLGYNLDILEMIYSNLIIILSISLVIILILRFVNLKVDKLKDKFFKSVQGDSHIQNKINIYNYFSEKTKNK